MQGANGKTRVCFRRQQDAGSPDTMVSRLGLTGLQFINVHNGCATGGSALISAYNAIRSGTFVTGIAVGFDKHERGAFRVRTRGDRMEWYGESGMALTTQFFGMKINRICMILESVKIHWRKFLESIS